MDDVYHIPHGLAESPADELARLRGLNAQLLQAARLGLIWAEHVAAVGEPRQSDRANEVAKKIRAAIAAAEAPAAPAGKGEPRI